MTLAVRRQLDAGCTRPLALVTAPAMALEVGTRLDREGLVLNVAHHLGRFGGLHRMRPGAAVDGAARRAAPADRELVRTQVLF